MEPSVFVIPLSCWFKNCCSFKDWTYFSASGKCASTYPRNKLLNYQKVDFGNSKEEYWCTECNVKKHRYPGLLKKVNIVISDKKILPKSNVLRWGLIAAWKKFGPNPDPTNFWKDQIPSPKYIFKWEKKHTILDNWNQNTIIRIVLKKGLLFLDIV